jgi:predicted small metal-binding protein
MKQFCCGDVVPGCTASFRSPNEEHILRAVAEHAHREHGLKEVPAALLSQVRSLIREMPAA